MKKETKKENKTDYSSVLLVGWQEGHIRPVKTEWWATGVVVSNLSVQGRRCRFAYDPADAIASSLSLVPANSDFTFLVLPFWYWLNG